MSVFAPLINYGLGHIKGSLSPWKYMYLVAGAITILWSLVILFLMPPDPIRMRGLTERERFIREEWPAMVERIRRLGLNVEQLLQASGNHAPGGSA